MVGVRTMDLVVLSVVVFCTTCSALKLDLSQLLKSRAQNHIWPEKRAYADVGKFSVSGNPCPEPEKPFPCKTKMKCIPMAYVCDDNFDCYDGYDENPEVCTAFARPPVEDLLAFLQQEHDWIIPNMFDGIDAERVAHALAVSQTVDDFRRRLNLPGSYAKKLRVALQAVDRNREEYFEKNFDMPSSSWDGVSEIFSRLLKSGFM